MENLTVVIKNSLLRKLENRVQELERPVIGFLFGTCRRDELHVIGASQCEEIAAQHLHREYTSTLKHLPAGVEICGIYFKTSSADSSVITKKVCQLVLPASLNAFLGESAFLYAFDQEEITNSKGYWYQVEQQELNSARVAFTDDDVTKQLMLFRIKADIPLGFDHSPDTGELEDYIMGEMQYLEETLESFQTAFHIDGSNFILRIEDPQDKSTKTGIDNCPCKEIFKHIDRDEVPERNKRIKAGDFTKEVIHVSLLLQITGPRATQRCIASTPVIHHEHKDFKYYSMSLPVDVVALVSPDDPVRRLPYLFLQGLNRQITSMGESLLLYSLEGDVYLPRPFHCLPYGLGHLITVVYPDGVDETKLETSRREVHRRFLLPTDRPLVRRLNSYIFPDEKPKEGYLLNTHIGIPKSADGKEYLVQGNYSYHHYMQDRINDNGWGCAYRSLQTVVSWFRYQAYTDKPIPTHREIQQALVDVKDKEPNFIDSKKWIGSTEVSYVLDHLIGVTSKILFVSTGAELSSKSRELAMHFENQGSPIMIGGGVLAHTILGINWNEDSGKVRFLILDPHYTGGEDLKTIQDKGWCGWKGPEFWDQNAFYNLCLPQRPKMM